MIVGDLKRALTREELEVLEKIKKTSKVTPETARSLGATLDDNISEVIFSIVNYTEEKDNYSKYVKDPSEISVVLQYIAVFEQEYHDHYMLAAERRYVVLGKNNEVLAKYAKGEWINPENQHMTQNDAGAYQIEYKVSDKKKAPKR